MVWWSSVYAVVTTSVIGGCSCYLLVVLILSLSLLPCVSSLAAAASSSSSGKTTLDDTTSLFPSPPGLEYYPFQKEAIDVLTRSSHCLLCDEMGLGKTVSAIGGLNSLQEEWTKVLIVTPKSLLPQWKTELERWLLVQDDDDSTIKKTTLVNMATAKGGIPPSPVSCNCNNVLLINYDIVSRYRPELDEMGAFDVLICDEAHYLKNGASRRTIAILGGDDDGSKNNRKGPIQARRMWFLTGSPVLNNPIELFPLLHALDPHGERIPQLRNMDEFCNRYCIKHGTRWGDTYYKGGKNLPELRNRLRSGDPPLMLRRTKKDVLKDLPKKLHQLLPLDDDVVVQQEEITLQQALATIETEDLRLEDVKVKDLKRRLVARGLPTSGRKAVLLKRLKDRHSISSSPRRSRPSDSISDVPNNVNTTEVFDSVGSALRLETGGRHWNGLQDILKGSWFKGDQGAVIMGALAQARHATALEKVPYAIEIIANIIVSQKVVVFAHHRDVQDALFEAFEDRAVILHGGSSQDERAHVVQQFQQDDSIGVFIGSIRAAGVGVTLTAASHVVFVEFDWSPMIVMQAEDRCHRLGQDSSVLIQYLFFRGTIDEHLASLLLSKQNTVAAAVDVPTGSTSWVFDFGKHKGMTVADVAAGDPRYLSWIVENEAHVQRKGLAKALSALGYISEKGIPTPKQTVISDGMPKTLRSVQKASSSNISSPTGNLSRATKHGDFIMLFGKHKGKRLGDIPRGYRQWLIWSGASRRNARLRAALRGLEVTE